MKTAKYLLTGTTNKFIIQVTDALGRDYVIERAGYIYSHYYPEDLYEILTLDFSTIAKFMIEEPVEVTKDTYAKINTVKLLRTEQIPASKIVEVKYMFYLKPIKYLSGINCEKLK
jgi:hypothetical protein